MNTSIDDIELIRKMYSTKTVLTEESELESSQASRVNGESRYYKANRITIEKLTQKNKIDEIDSLPPINKDS